MHVDTLVTLPNLPGMFVRSLFTVARKDQDAAEAQVLNAEFSAPPFSAELVQRYHDAFGGFVSPMPLTLIYCLAQRVHLAQMLGEHFPWPAPGLVHVSNHIEQHQQLDAEDGFQLKASVKIPARGPKVSPRRLRPVFTVEFWQAEQHVATCISEYQVMPKQQERPRKAKDTKVVDAPEGDWQRMNTWQLDAQTSRSYARLSGDFNPIHLHPLLSRWFGFDQPIIHGMYMSARAQAEIERSVKQPITAINVTFKRPVPLPANVSLWHCQTDPNTGKYQVCGAEDNLQRLEGTVTWAV